MSTTKQEAERALALEEKALAFEQSLVRDAQQTLKRAEARLQEQYRSVRDARTAADAFLPKAEEAMRSRWSQESRTPVVIIKRTPKQITTRPIGETTGERTWRQNPRTQAWEPFPRPSYYNGSYHVLENVPDA